MKSFIFILLLCSFHYGYGASYEKNINGSNNVSNISEIKQSDEISQNNLQPKSLSESVQRQTEHKSLDARILYDLSSNTQNVYLPNAINDITNAAYPNTAGSTISNTPEILDLQVPTSANTNRVLLHLPSQQLPSHRTFVAPPRRHYRITLIRNKKPTPAPKIINPEVEEKTLIYVLVKKPDETPAQIADIQNNVQTNIKQNAPEVYFIKYKENNSHNITSTNVKIDQN